MKMKRAVVLGAGGFIGGHIVSRLKADGYYVRGVDLKEHYFGKTDADEFIVGDLRDVKVVEEALDEVDEIYQLAADMGGAEYIFTGDNDADIMYNSAQINLHVCNVCDRMYLGQSRKIKVFYSSSACMYPEYNQLDPLNPECGESSAYPAAPDSEYGWEKLFSERLYLSYHRNKGLDVRVARFHNIFGPYGTWRGGKEKAPAAITRKVCESRDGTIDVFGDGTQTRSFLYIDECVEGVMRLMASDFIGPVNIGSDEMVSINQLVDMVASISNKDITINHIDGPLGVKGRNSDNKLIFEKLNWRPTQPLREGLVKLNEWIRELLY